MFNQKVTKDHVVKNYPQSNFWPNSAANISREAKNKYRGVRDAPGTGA